MGRHKIWRSLVKKMRRKRLRQQRAKERDALLNAAQKKQELSPTYQAWIKEQEALDQFRDEEETRLSEERNRQWLITEVEAQRSWCLRQEKAEKAKKEREEAELRIRMEWEEEQKKQELIEMEKKKEQEEKLQKQEELLKQIIEFVDKGGERPSFANVVNETNPNKPLCPFFIKTGACRFGDRCSRNHPRPALSKTVLLSNFYSHFGMDQSMLDEYDSDLLLEYEDSETYQHFREFYNDVVPELFRYGQPVAVIICRNSEPHLRGNVYVEYGREAEAAKAVTSLNGRWYGGKLISAQFTSIPTWKAAICGLFHRGRCPKGKACNFLHIFHNPQGEFSNPDRERERLARREKSRKDREEERDFSERSNRSSRRGEEESRRGSQRRRESSKREWRWSESPERVAFPRDNANEGEDKAGYVWGRDGESPNSGSRNNSERGRRRRSSRERREDGKGLSKRDKDNDGRRSSSRRSHNDGREEVSYSSSRERHSRGSDIYQGREKKSRGRSRERKHSRYGRQSQERNSVMSEESVAYSRRSDKGNIVNGIEEQHPEEVDQLNAVSFGDRNDIPDLACRESSSEI